MERGHQQGRAAAAAQQGVAAAGEVGDAASQAEVVGPGPVEGALGSGGVALPSAGATAGPAPGDVPSATEAGEESGCAADASAAADAADGRGRADGALPTVDVVMAPGTQRACLR